MSGEVTITVIGNLTADPELRFTQSGAAVANLTIASTPRTFDKNANEWKDGDALFMRCSLWREAAEHAAESLTKGMRVIAVGSLKQRSYETSGGEKRTVVEMDVEEIAPSLKYATAVVAKAQPGGNRNNGGGGSQPQQQRPQQAARSNVGTQQQDDPWATSPQGGNWGAASQEPPF